MMLIYGRDFQVASLDGIHDKIAGEMKRMPRGRVLDFPAGTGCLSWMLHSEGFEVTAADIETEIFGNPEIPVVRCNLDGPFPFSDASFEYAFCIEGPEHAENLYFTFREFSRVLKPGGLFTMSCPNYSNLESRLKNVFYGIVEPVEPYRKRKHQGNGHVNRPPFALLAMALNYAGLEIKSVAGEKTKTGQLWLYPLAWLIFLFTKIKGEKGRRKYWLDRSNAPAVLMGGNSLIIRARKIR